MEPCQARERSSCHGVRAALCFAVSALGRHPHFQTSKKQAPSLGLPGRATGFTVQNRAEEHLVGGAQTVVMSHVLALVPIGTGVGWLLLRGWHLVAPASPSGGLS